MNSNIETLITQIQERIAQFQAAIDVLRLIDGACARPPDAEPERPQVHRGRPKKTAAPSSNGKHDATPRRGRKFKVIDAMREIISGKTGSFTAAQIREEVAAKYPHFKDRLQPVSVNLIDMSNCGELHREGKGRDATYRKAKLKNGPTNKEEAWRQFRATIPKPAEIDA